MAPSSVAEDGATNLVYTFTRDTITGTLTVDFTVGGTASFSGDYTQSGAASYSATSGSVAFGAGQGTVTVTIDPSADVSFELNETVVLTISSNAAYTIGANAAATGTIATDDVLYLPLIVK